jgi:hypothetical protein
VKVNAPVVLESINWDLLCLMLVHLSEAKKIASGLPCAIKMYVQMCQFV